MHHASKIKVKSYMDIADLINAIPNLLRSSHAAVFRFSAVLLNNLTSLYVLPLSLGYAVTKRDFFHIDCNFFYIRKKIIVLHILSLPSIIGKGP